MKQSAAERPDPTLQRKAALARGGALDHSGSVRIETIPDFDLDRTIFQTLEGSLSRKLVAVRVGQSVDWDAEAAQSVQAAYEATREEHPLPEIDPELIRFLVEECDFDVEHADGSFLDHLYFCLEYGVQHYPQHSPIVMFLHSILGTGTNTFAMSADKIPALKEHLTPFEWTHVEAFPSVLRLLYPADLRRELRANLDHPEALQSIRFHRVIDNAPLELGGEDFWIALNYQLIHLVDFLPVANWSAHLNDNAFIVFRDLHDLLGQAGRLDAQVAYEPASGPRRLDGEHTGLLGWLATLVPVSLSERLAARSVARFSERIGHSLAYEITWA